MMNYVIIFLVVSCDSYNEFIAPYAFQTFTDFFSFIFKCVKVHYL